MLKRSILILIVGVLCVTCTEKGIELIQNGQSQYQIVWDSDEPEVRQAAKQMQYYLHAITGVQLPLARAEQHDPDTPAITIGMDAGTTGSSDITIRTEGQNLKIRGGSAIATKYAVYEFLERYLGCQWFTPEVDYVPSITNLTIQPIDFSYQPRITTRTVHARLFYEDSVFADKHKVTYEAFPTYAPGARVHTFHRFLPEEQFYEDHPEYFALRGTRRLPTQLCLTNETVLQIVKDSVAALFKRNPQAKVVSVSQDDNQQHCQCDACHKIDEEEGSPAGTMIRFVNQVAAAFPDKTISTLAYQYTRKPCKTKPAANVLVTLCSIECDRSAAIAEKCQEFAEDLKGWGQLTSNIRIWDYTTQFTNFLAPFPNLHTLQPNVQLFRDNNAKWIFEQHSNNPSELFELRSYLLAKLLWNPDLNVDSLMTSFINGYYELAGPLIKQYVDKIHSELARDPEFFLFLYGDPSQAFSSFLGVDQLQQYNNWFDVAEVLVAHKPEVLNRVKRARLGVDYATLEACRKNVSSEFTLLESSGESKKINPKVSKRLKSFYSTCRENNITMMNEMRFSVQEYYDNYQAALKVALKPNKALGKTVITLTQPKKYADEDPKVLTDGALGGSSFYANWLGYEGNNMEVVLDLGQATSVNSISMAFLQVTNHIVFLPEQVQYWGSLDNERFLSLGVVKNPTPLNKTSKINDIQYFDLAMAPKTLRYIKVVATNTPTPYWHHAAGLPSWIFADEILVD